MMTFRNLFRFVPAAALAVATVVAPATTPAKAQPTCREGVNRLCLSHWQDLGYSSFSDCIAQEDAIQCPGCPAGTDPDNPGGIDCTVYP